MIDNFTQDRPVLVRRFDRKVYLANSFALELAGISSSSGDPEGISVQRMRMVNQQVLYLTLYLVQWNQPFNSRQY